MVESPSVRILAERAGDRRDVFDFFCGVGEVMFSCLCGVRVGRSGSLIISHRLLFRHGLPRDLRAHRIRRRLRIRIRRRPQFHRSLVVQ